MNINQFKKHFYCFFILLLFINCSNDEDPIPENAVFEPQTELISLEGNQSQLEVHWKPVFIEKFKSYKVYRFHTYNNESFRPEGVVGLGELVFEATNNRTTSFIDTKVPYNSFVMYAVVTEYLNEEKNVIAVVSKNHLSFENKDLSFAITSVEKSADGSLKVTWDRDSNAGFESYTVYALSSPFLSHEDVMNNKNKLKSITIQNENSISDTVQYTDQIVYYAVSKVINGKTIWSKNLGMIDNPRSLKFRPGQTFKNPYVENEMIIINKEGEIVFYDINSLTSTKISTNGYIFFCSIGEYNGVKDLYVPSINGNVFLVDLKTHQIKKTINLKTDYDILTAIPINEHILFIEKHPYAEIGGLFVYNVENDKVLNRNGSFGAASNAKLFYGKDNYFFILDSDGREYGSSSAIRRLNINGDQVTTDLLWNESVADSRLFALSEDKSFFVSTNFGFQSDVNYENFTEVTTKSYSSTLNLADAKITSDNRIYFAVPGDGRISVFEKNNFSAPVKEYKTNGGPLFLEVFDKQIISLNQCPNTCILETTAK